MSIAVKICGLTRPEQAQECAAAGAAAIGLVFFERSPRNVSSVQAREICAAVAGQAVRVGVFVDRPIDQVAELAAGCGLDVAQLHGHETPEDVTRLQAAGVRVIKVLTKTGSALLEEAERFSGADGILVECGKGILPGGNGASWDWGGARPLTALRPFALAGGLSAATVAQAIAASGAGAVDVSSAVEQAPGVKDLGLVRAFIDAAHRAASDMDGVRVF